LCILSFGVPKFLSLISRDPKLSENYKKCRQTERERERERNPGMWACDSDEASLQSQPVLGVKQKDQNPGPYCRFDRSTEF
jgi:hypothetical protein